MYLGVEGSEEEYLLTSLSLVESFLTISTYGERNKYLAESEDVRMFCAAVKTGWCGSCDWRWLLIKDPRFAGVPELLQLPHFTLTQQRLLILSLFSLESLLLLYTM